MLSVPKTASSMTCFNEPTKCYSLAMAQALKVKFWAKFWHPCTVPVIWNWKNRCILGVFVTQKFYLHELWNLHVIRMCPKASLTNRLWEIRNSSTQSWDIVILRKQDWSIFAQFSAFYLEIEQKCLNLAFLK